MAIALSKTSNIMTDDLISHLSPLKWAHINLTGHYIWNPHENQKGELHPSETNQNRLSGDYFPFATVTRSTARIYKMTLICHDDI